MSNRTQFIETEALLLALDDAEVDSGAFTVDAYLMEQFTENELRKLAEGADVLSDRTWKALQRRRSSEP